MKIPVKSVLIPWIVYVIIIVKAIADYIINNPSFAQNDEILLYFIVLIILWVERRGILATLQTEATGMPFYGLIVCTIGLFVYVVGRLYPLLVLELWGFFFITSGLITAFAPKENLKSAVSIALSGTVLVILGKIAPELLSSKLAISIAGFTAKILNQAVLPVVSSGVYLYFGPYTAEVTHACSGMNSIFSLFALSLLYLKEGVSRKYWHLAILVILVIPVAVITNAIRVILLVLTTWNLGESFSSGPFHETLGIIVFVLALGILISFDKALFIIDKNIQKSRNLPPSEK